MSTPLELFTGRLVATLLTTPGLPGLEVALSCAADSSIGPASLQVRARCTRGERRYGVNRIWEIWEIRQTVDAAAYGGLEALALRDEFLAAIAEHAKEIAHE